MSSEERISPAAWAGWACLLVLGISRAMVGFDDFPHWSGDPLRLPVPVTGLTPVWTMVLDAAALAGAGLVLIGRRAGVLVWLGVLALIGVAAAMWHGTMSPWADVDHLRLGTTWSAAVLGGVAMAAACQHPRLMRLTLAIVCGAIVVMVLRGTVQVTVEHAETVRQFRENREVFLLGQGMTPDSSAARAFERRLSQPEATGWFGMSNVFATFMAGGLVLMLGSAVWALRRVSHPLHRPSEGWTAVIGLGALAAGAGLWLSGSKGGAAAAGLGVVFVAVTLLRDRVVSSYPRLSNPRVGGVLGIALLGVTLALVMARGLAGTELGERSVLFRWFYLEGAWRVIQERWPLGTGPAGFKDAYAVLKPPLSPEEVASPHSVLFDYAATLGAAGLAWVGVVLAFAWRCAAGLLNPATDTERSLDAQDATPSSLAGGQPRADARILGIIVAVVMIGTMWLERGMTTPEIAAARMLGLLAWIGVGLGMMAFLRTRVGVASGRALAAAAGLVVLVHGQIEVTPVWPNSAGLAWLAIGAGAAGALIPAARRGWRWAGVVVGAAAVGISIWIASIAGFGAMQTWEQSLHAAASRARVLSGIWTRLDAMQSSRGMGSDSMERIAADVADAIGEFPPRDTRGFERAMHELTARTAGQSRRALAAAIAAQPRHLGTRQALARLALTEATSLVALGKSPTDALGAAQEAMDTMPRPVVSGWHMARANVLVARAGFAEGESKRALLADALEELSEGARRDPFSVQVPVAAVGVALALGEPRRAAEWARVALVNDRLQGLDPLRQLTEAERTRLNAIADAPSGPTD